MVGFRSYSSSHLRAMLGVLPSLVVWHTAAGGAKTANDFLVTGLDEIEPAFGSWKGTMFAGLLPTASDDDAAEFMFWAFVPDRPTVPDSMVLWLNGGPGCSSILGGVLLENSPIHLGAHPAGTCCLGPDDRLRANPHSWTRATTMLYVEMPTRVGFSTGGKEPQDETDIGRDMYGFLQSFYSVFPHLLGSKLSLFGESYAGYFVPSIAHRIAKENAKDQPGVFHIPLDGIGLGNAWMDAVHQGPAVIDYAWWHGMIDAHTRDAFHSEWTQCYTLRQAVTPPFHSFTTPDECGIMEAVLAAAGQGVLPDGKTPNLYDVTTFDPYAVVGSHNSTLTRFMNDPRVRRALHAPLDIQWAGCIEGGGRRRRLLGLLDRDRPLSMVPYVAELLDVYNVRVLVYNGDLDLSVNAQGSESLLNNMQWKGRQAWKVAARGIWMSADDTVAGYVKKCDNLTFLVVKNSGHLVPLNQPSVALDLVERFLGNASFSDIPLPSFLRSPRESETETGPSLSSLEDEVLRRDEGYSAFWTRIVHQVGLAVVCFFAGVISAHSWRRQGYDSVSPRIGSHL